MNKVEYSSLNNETLDIIDANISINQFKCISYYWNASLSQNIKIGEYVSLQEAQRAIKNKWNELFGHMRFNSCLSSFTAGWSASIQMLNANNELFKYDNGIPLSVYDKRDEGEYLYIDNLYSIGISPDVTYSN